MDTMKTTNNAAARVILQREESHSVAVRNDICRQMEALHYGAVLWDENVFGTTNYPLISDPAGYEYNVHGLALDGVGALCAVVRYPAGANANGIEAYTPDQAARLIKPSDTMCEGTPEEWDILGDCFQTVLQILRAEKIEEQPLPWW